MSFPVKGKWKIIQTFNFLVMATHVSILKRDGTQSSFYLTYALARTAAVSGDLIIIFLSSESDIQLVVNNFGLFTNRDLETNINIQVRTSSTYLFVNNADLTQSNRNYLT